MTDSIAPITNIPRATDNTRGLNSSGQFWVLGGDDTTFPNPTNEVDIYDPLSDSWALGPAFVTPRRNFPTDTDGTSRIWLAGGYDSGGSPLASMEIFCAAGQLQRPRQL